MFSRTAVVIALVLSLAAAQYSSVTTLCTNTGGSTRLVFPLNDTKVYYSAEVFAISEFEYRLVAEDGKPLGFKEMYDYDEDDETGTNYDCYVQSTTDATTCPNTYLAGGYVQPTFNPRRIVKFGFEKCADRDANAAIYSSQVYIELWFRSTPSNDLTTVGSCTKFQKVIPTSFCNRNSAGQAFVSTLLVAAVVIASILL